MSTLIEQQATDLSAQLQIPYKEVLDKLLTAYADKPVVPDMFLADGKTINPEWVADTDRDSQAWAASVNHR